MNTLSTSIKAEFKAILSTESILLKAEGDDYYITQTKLNDQLREFLRTDFSVLNSKQLLKLCSLVSSHRPVQPFSFLITCSNLVK